MSLDKIMSAQRSVPNINCIISICGKFAKTLNNAASYIATKVSNLFLSSSFAEKTKVDPDLERLRDQHGFNSLSHQLYSSTSASPSPSMSQSSGSEEQTKTWTIGQWTSGKTTREINTSTFSELLFREKGLKDGSGLNVNILRASVREYTDSQNNKHYLLKNNNNEIIELDFQIHGDKLYFYN